MAHGSAFRFVFSPPHPAARPFLVIGAILVLAGLIFASWLAWIGVFFILFCLYFFRDPEPRRRRNSALASCRAGGWRSSSRCSTCM
jgi:phosphatidylserine decarboxylase